VALGDRIRYPGGNICSGVHHSPPHVFEMTQSVILAPARSRNGDSKSDRTVVGIEESRRSGPGKSRC
jgi:hypothetical protein